MQQQITPTWSNGTEDELAEEVRWASIRPGVRTRHADTTQASKDDRHFWVAAQRFRDHSAFEILQDLLCMHSLHLNADSRTIQYCFLVRPWSAMWDKTLSNVHYYRIETVTYTPWFEIWAWWWWQTRHLHWAHLGGCCFLNWWRRLVFS